MDYYLISNRSTKGVLIPEHKTIDYFLLLILHMSESLKKFVTYSLLRKMAYLKVFIVVLVVLYIRDLYDTLMQELLLKTLFPI